MSLVGSLEDLGLGDILQIVSLSRKSGLLLLRSEEGDGRIVFSDGLVRAAYVKSEPEDLRGLLVPGGFVDAGELDLAIETAEQSGLPLDEVIAQRTGLTAERLDSLRREHVERAVLRMFTWRVGEFSFDVRDGIEQRDAELALPTGINSQYLMMEATRLGDESRDTRHSGEDGTEDSAAEEDCADDDFVLSGESGVEETPVVLPGGIPEPAEDDPDDPREVLALSAAARAQEEPETEESEESTPEALASEAVSDERDDESAPEALAASSNPPLAPAANSVVPEPSPGSVPLVVIDPELRALEWVKSVLAGLFVRVHIFQRCEDGIGRVRQYLSRAQVPAVLISSRIPSDPLYQTAGLTELLRRLRTQVPRMPVLVMHDGSAEMPLGADGADAIVTRPTTGMLVDRRSQAEVAQQAEQLRDALELWSQPVCQGAPAVPARSAALPASAPAPGLQRLREISARLRDPATRGDVLTLVLEFAAESFGRVAMFMVRDDVAVGIAQRGLPAAGGPGDDEFRELRVSLDEPAWFRAAIESGEAHTAPPQDEGDRRLWAMLGRSAPGEAHLAPIESGGHVAALLYADNLPEGSPIGDTTMLSIVLHEAGLVLDRVLLERALAEAEGTH
ncbi:MAG: DUF4388 domain-containing protein [Deltaproteobacteria bacterium]|nr:DUF4388 domain-containing protein [Deltaproteobacteria bacterium]